ncbi:transcriptional regulator with XRE-family HTH domain [Saccharothrix ecbatanensis]|uniref:Transcriptional regulator with XRE-family HTH domain n=1 Tax=Saccharothrix ecbatanensis TaxID=1105145 RepID=A0A7W9HDR8_9PSEU|nr:helix-turn-helix transcriptional regulator [Saccharothrix ecbatanensis]MBB5800402.1 transcriptional regulator with XRE-family HTH domain [Saccharothrix ecbatanensis]
MVTEIAEKIHRQPRLSTALSRELGEELRKIRRRARMGSAETADALGWSLGKLSKLETGSRGTSPGEIGALLGRLGTAPPTRDRILAIAGEPATGSFMRPHRTAPDTLTALSLHERMARTITTYEPFTVPALAQTQDYTRALTGDSAIAAARIARQEALHALHNLNRPHTILYLHESAVRGIVGGPAVMRDQMLRLAMMCETTRVTPRLIPMDAPFDQTVLRHGALLTFAEPIKSLAYAETDTATVFHEAPQIIAHYETKMLRLDTLALPQAQSRDAFTYWADVYDKAT